MNAVAGIFAAMLVLQAMEYLRKAKSTTDKDFGVGGNVFAVARLVVGFVMIFAVAVTTLK